MDGVAEVTLIPGTGDIFEIRLDNQLLFSYKEMGRFPKVKEMKRSIRDKIGLDIVIDKIYHGIS